MILDDLDRLYAGMFCIKHVSVKMTPDFAVLLVLHEFPLLCSEHMVGVLQGDVGEHLPVDLIIRAYTEVDKVRTFL